MSKVVWPFVPQVGPTQTVEWLTDVLSTRGAEQRISLREAPRTGITYNYVLSPREFADAKRLAQHGAEGVLLPDWLNIVAAADLSGGAEEILVAKDLGHLAGGEALIWSDEGFELVQILTASADGRTLTVSPIVGTYSRPSIMSVREAYWGRPFQAMRGASEFVVASGAFDFQPSPVSTASPFSSYLGHDLMLDRPGLSGTTSEKFELETERLDWGLGKFWEGDARTYSTAARDLSWFLDSPEELQTLTSWLNSLRGRWRGFWVPSWNPDLTVLGNLPSSVVRVAGSFQNASGHVITPKGVPHKITSALAGLPGETNLKLTPALAPGTQQLSFLAFARFDSDRYEVKHGHGRSAVIRIPIKEVPAP